MKLGRGMLSCAAMLLVGLMAVGLTGCNSAATPSEITVNTSNTESGITVEGTSKITVIPDIAILDCGVSTIAKNPQDAQSQSATKINSIIDKLKALGIEEKDMQTASIYLSEDYDYTDEGKKSNGYKSAMTLTIKVRDITKAGEVMKQVAEAGADEIGGLQYDVSEKDAKYNEALGLALENAKVKAESILKSDSKTVGNIISLTEHQTNYRAPLAKNANIAYDGAEAGSANIMQGEAEITANVSVTFEIK